MGAEKTVIRQESREPGISITVGACCYGVVNCEDHAPLLIILASSRLGVYSTFAVHRPHHTDKLYTPNVGFQQPQKYSQQEDPRKQSYSHTSIVHRNDPGSPEAAYLNGFSASSSAQFQGFGVQEFGFLGSLRETDVLEHFDAR